MRVAERLRELQDKGVVTPGEAKAVAGHLLLDTADAHQQSRTTVYRDRARARELGLVLADGVTEEVEVDVHAALEQALEADGWYAAG
jgi:hypothetical protein